MKFFLGLLLFWCASLCTHSQLYYPNRAQTINDITQIPIKTLTAISNLAQYTRPIGQIIQRRRPGQRSGQTQQQLYYPETSYSPQISRAAKLAGLQPAADGSFFKI